MTTKDEILAEMDLAADLASTDYERFKASHPNEAALAAEFIRKYRLTAGYTRICKIIMGEPYRRHA